MFYSFMCNHDCRLNDIDRVNQQTSQLGIIRGVLDIPDRRGKK